MEDGAPAHCAATTKQWHTQHGVKLFGGWLGNSPDLNPIESLWLQMKQLQSKERATLATGLKKSLQSLGEDHAVLPQISLRKHAEAYEGGC